MKDVFLLDVEVQRDFFVPTGSVYTPEADLARSNIYALFDGAKRNEWPILSTVLRVPPGRPGPLADRPHCLEGTPGERKLSRTLVQPLLNLGLLNSTDLPADLFERYRQVIFEKRNPDIFLHARAERLLSELPGGRFILCGAGVAHGVVQAAVGLRMRGFEVVLATDAVLGLDDPAVGMAYRRMMAKGVQFLRTREILSPPRSDRAAGWTRPLSAAGK